MLKGNNANTASNVILRPCCEKTIFHPLKFLVTRFTRLILFIHRRKCYAYPINESNAVYGSEAVHTALTTA